MADGRPAWARYWGAPYAVQPPLGFWFGPAVLIGLPVGPVLRSTGRHGHAVPAETAPACAGISGTSSLRRQLSSGWLVQCMSLVQ
jgi:hypothetical protein